MILAEEINDCFDFLDGAKKERVLEVTSLFHVRDGTENNDGSRGRIEITPKELNDCLAYVIVTL